VTNLKVCSQKIVPIFFFFFVWAGTLWALVTRPLRVLKDGRPDFGKALKGPEKLPHSVPKGPKSGLVPGKVFSEKFSFNNIIAKLHSLKI
jgi:hypothetical protein